MPDSVTSTPAPAPAPAPADPAPVAAPAAPPSIVPTREPRPRLGAKKALGLEQSVNKMMGQEIKKARERLRAQGPVTELPPVEPPAAKRTPARPAAPAPAAAPAPSTAPAPAAEATPTKVRIGDKEYTMSELEARLREEPAPARVPAPHQAQEEPPAPPQPTAEEIQQREAQFLQQTVTALNLPALTEEQMDTILAGGQDAVAALNEVRKQDVAHAILQARKGITAGLNPVMQQLFAAIKPLVDNHQNLTRYNIEQQFVAKHKDFAPHLDTARQIAQELVRRYPEHVSRMSQDQFIDEVARQTDNLLTTEHRRWFPQGNGNWRAAAAAPAPAPAATLAPAPAPAPTAVRAPAANAPIAAGGAVAPDWRKSVATSMRA